MNALTHNNKQVFKGSRPRAYEAKKRSESAPGVGGETDVAIIDKKVRFLSPKELALLEKTFKQKEKEYQPIVKRIKKQVEKLKLW